MKLLTSLFSVLFSRSTSSSLDTSYQRETKLKSSEQGFQNNFPWIDHLVEYYSAVWEVSISTHPTGKHQTLGNIPNLLLKVIPSYFRRKIEK